MRWAILSEGDVGAAFQQTKCCLCGSALNDGQAWSPRNTDDPESVTLLGLVKSFNPANREIDLHTLVFCTECRERTAGLLLRPSQ